MLPNLIVNSKETSETCIQKAGGSQPSIKEQSFKEQSLASHFNKIQISLILLFASSGIVCITWDTFYNLCASTNYNVNIKSLPFAPGLSYSKHGSIGDYTVMGGVNTFFDSDAYVMGTVTFIDMVLPYLYVLILMTIFFIKVKQKNRKYRTVCLFILIQTGQLQFITVYSGSFLEIVTSNITSTPNYNLFIKEAISNSACISVIWIVVFTLSAFVLLWVDQFKSYQSLETNKRRFDDNKWYTLSFVHTKNIKSLFGAVTYSLYLTILLCSVYILLESMYTAQIGFQFGGLFSGTNPQPLIYSSFFLAINVPHYLDINGFLSAMYTADIMFYVFVIPLIQQILLTLIWFVPLKNAAFKYVLRLIICLQTINQFCALFLGSILLIINDEVKKNTSWVMENQELPGLCGDGTFIKDTIPGGCYYAETFYNLFGLVLMGVAIIIQWVALIYTIHASNILGINAIKLL